MKIVCDSCGAKYSIADEKVAGKVFKIRCKKCSSVIVVRGDQQPAEAQDEATAIYAYGGDAAWHVVVAGEQQGPFTPAQVAALIGDGSIDWEAYVWREGFEGWKVIRDVPELAQAIAGEGESASPAVGQPSAALSADDDPFGAGASMGHDPFAGAPSPAAASRAASSIRFSQPPAAAEPKGGRLGHDTGADLFAQADAAASPFGAAAPEEDDDVVASAPGPRVSMQDAMTGQRNENSVLFSLSNLQALATGPSPSAAPSRSAAGKPAPKAGHATGEGSGLIDIRALASASGVVGQKSEERASIDDLLSIGGAQTGLGSTFTSLVLAPAAEVEESNKGLLIGIGAGAGVAVVGLLAALLFMKGNDSDPIATAAPIGPVDTAAQAATAEPSGTAAAPTQPGTAAPVAEAPKPAEPVPAATPKDEPKDRDDTKRAASASTKKAAASTASTKTTSSSDTGSAPTPSAPAPTKTAGRAGGGDDLDSLLAAALSGDKKAASKPAGPAPAPASNLPDTPSRSDVASALRSVQPQVKACANGQTGVAQTQVTVQGSTGKVTNVSVGGAFAGTPVASCIQRVVSGAKFPPFKQSTFSVTFPYAL